MAISFQKERRIMNDREILMNTDDAGLNNIIAELEKWCKKQKELSDDYFNAFQKINDHCNNECHDQKCRMHAYCDTSHIIKENSDTFWKKYNKIEHTIGNLIYKYKRQLFIYMKAKGNAHNIQNINYDSDACSKGSCYNIVRNVATCFSQCPFYIHNKE